MDKLSSSGKTLPTNLKLAAYLHRIEDIYLDFATANRSAACTKVLEISTVIAELKDESRQDRSAESTALTTKTKDSYKRRYTQTQRPA